MAYSPLWIVVDVHSGSTSSLWRVESVMLRRNDASTNRRDGRMHKSQIEVRPNRGSFSNDQFNSVRGRKYTARGKRSKPPDQKPFPKSKGLPTSSPSLDV